MVQLVAKDPVTGLEDGLQDTDVGLVSAVENQRTFGALERGQCKFEFFGQRGGAANQAGGTSAGTETMDGLDGCLFEALVMHETQVIVAAEIQRRTAFHFAMREAFVLHFAAAAQLARFREIVQRGLV